MFIEKLTKEERLIASEFHPEKWEGEYVKIIKSYDPGTWQVAAGYSEVNSYCKLNKYHLNQNIYPLHRFEGLLVDCCNVRWDFYIDSGYYEHQQNDIIPISREEFIEGCQSLLPDDLKELINWDKI